jgi:fluoride exporter
MAWFGVFLGGGIGSVLRYGLALALNSPGRALPFGTMLVNLLGCFILGYLSSHEWIESRLTETLRLAITTGILGGFTTFSTFGLESVRLYQSGQTFYGTAYVLVSLLGGLAAALMGMKLAI